MTISIWWIRRDLRLTDNQALSAALAAAEQVLPVFILDPRLLASPYTGDKRTAFLFDGLRALDADLRSRGSRLLVRRGDPVAVLVQLCHETGAGAVFAQRDYSPFAIRRDTAVQAALPVSLHLEDGVAARPPASIRKDDGEPFVVYTPFGKRWRALGPFRRSDILPAPQVIRPPAEPQGDEVPAAPALPSSVPFAAGEAEAKRRLGAFVTGEHAPIHDYAKLRDQPGADATSQLSPYLRWGMISPRLAALAAYEAIDRAGTRGGTGAAAAQKGADTWLAELIWREFYLAILQAFPYVRGSSFRREFIGIPWRNDDADFAAWCAGRTGYPIVDAAMRQIVTEGWMHNRCRMITASFLVKDLLIDWRWGERFFMQHLVDGDPAPNNGGWQWTAGTGTDAAPYFRVFNPVMQSQKFDPQGTYIRRWLPELAHVPLEFLHEPWKMEKSDQVKARCTLGADYPLPIVDHHAARDRVLEAYAAAKA
ncbi:MAG: deoxyribodipyrimidine photo-lyase [Caldilineaceae bacterium]